LAHGLSHRSLIGALGLVAALACSRRHEPAEFHHAPAAANAFPENAPEGVGTTSVILDRNALASSTLTYSMVSGTWVQPIFVITGLDDGDDHYAAHFERGLLKPFELAVYPGCALDFTRDEPAPEGEVQNVHVYRITCDERGDAPHEKE
jgi:hypothetical protein